MNAQDITELNDAAEIFDLGDATEQTEGLPNFPIAEAGSVLRTNP